MHAHEDKSAMQSRHGTDGVKSGRGLFIVLEGSDGSGKGTQLRHFVQRLQGQGRACYATAEPTASAIGQLIRHGLRGEHAFTAETMALLFAADRRHHIAVEVEPALARGDVVVCDRYDLSNIVYRAAEQPMLRCRVCRWEGDAAPWVRDADGAAKRQRCPTCQVADAFDWCRSDAITWARALSRGLPRPDLTVVLDVPVDVALARRKARGGVERYDDPAMQARVCELYRRAAELLPGERVAVVDGDAHEDVVADRVWAECAGLLP